MTPIALDHETDPTRRAIIAAINRLLAGTPKRSTGRLTVAQLAVEADVKRWRLTHQHTDLQTRFQASAAELQRKQAAHVRSADAYELLQHKHAELQRHCAHLEERLKIYANALHLLALEHAILSGRDADAAKIRVLPRSRPAP